LNVESSHDRLKEQIIPLALTVVIFAALVGLLFVEVNLLNRVSASEIVTHIRWGDILIGLTIYLKTSVDFAIFIGNLMHTFPGWKNRIAIEIGTSCGNAIGTFIILAIWNFFREVNWLLALMIFIASLVLLRMAEDGIEHARSGGLPRSLDPLVEHSIKSSGFINVFSIRTEQIILT
jgi:hypothetical protein